MFTFLRNPPAWIAIWVFAIAHLNAGDLSSANGQDPSADIDIPVPGPELLKFTPEEIEAAYDGKIQPEAVKMYLSIVRGGSMGGDEGWFGPAKTRFTWTWLTEHLAMGESEQISEKDFKGPEAVFVALDRNHDGQLQPEDLDWSDSNPWVQQSYMVNRMFRKMDPNGDGRISDIEWNQFFAKSTDKQLTFEQLRDSLLGQSQGGLGPGDGPSKEILVKGLLAGEIGSLREGPNLNDIAPDFELKTFDGKNQIRLSELFGTKPIVLVFGNFTCGPFRSMYPAVDELAKKYADQATFLGVYVREAHPTDGWAMRSNEKAGVQIVQPKSYEQRRDVASTCSAKLNMSIPLLVDDVDDNVGNSYSGMPARLYVIDPQGRVAYKSGRGPFGFKAGEMEQALQMTLLEFQAETKLSSMTSPVEAIAYQEARLPLLANDEIWQHLPKAQAAVGRQVPGWARALATDLPRTTAAMYEFRQAGMSDQESIALRDNQTDSLERGEQEIFQFVEQLTRLGSDISDEQYLRVANRWSDNEMVGIVLLTAYANFQDRLVHALALPCESDEALAPFD